MTDCTKTATAAIAAYAASLVPSDRLRPFIAGGDFEFVDPCVATARTVASERKINARLRWVVEIRSGSLYMTVNPPKNDCTSSNPTPTIDKRNIQGRSDVSFLANHVARMNIKTRPPATNLWRCSQKTPPVISGIIVPKHVGQSGHAKLDSVAWTMLPRKSRPSVQTTVTL